MDSDRKTEAGIHAGGIVFDGLVNEIGQAREVNNGLHFLRDGKLSQTKDGGVELDIFPAG